jgi:hypothetical protein
MIWYTCWLQFQGPIGEEHATTLGGVNSFGMAQIRFIDELIVRIRSEQKIAGLLVG